MASNPQQQNQENDTALIEATATMRDLFTYPPPGTTAPAADAGTAPALGTTGRLAEDTIRQALGWRFRGDDVRGFQSALTRSFSRHEDADGRTEWKWTPQTYAVQADMGEITGAQASILGQARMTIDFVLPLIDGLKPLRLDCDSDDSRAVLSLVRMKLNTILSELGRVGGPRVQRVDAAFEELFGLPVIDVKPCEGGARSSEVIVIADTDDWLKQLKCGRTDTPYSLLYQLSEEFGLLPDLANTIEEERNLTNALIIADSAIALRTAWVSKRIFFDRNDGTKQRFLGTQLVWISRQLEVVAESVRDAYRAMDSVYFGPEEREATDIHFAFDCDRPDESKVGAAPISVGDLLDWVYTFATQEGPQLLQDGGKDGVLAFRATLPRLHTWVHAAHEFAKAGSGEAPCSFFNARVRRALCDIEHQLAVAISRAQGITRHARQSPQRGEPIADLAHPPTPRVLSIGVQPPVATSCGAGGDEKPGSAGAKGLASQHTQTTDEQSKTPPTSTKQTDGSKPLSSPHSGTPGGKATKS